MKVALVTDTHSGVRNDLQAIADHQNRFWEELFFPELKKRNINTILHGGDFFDKRQYLSLKTMQNTKEVFCRLLKEYDCNMHLILGNHDVLYKNTNIINSPENFFGKNDRVTIINRPTLFDDKILMVPWINKENYDEFLDAIKTTDAIYCYGHFEISGFEMHKGTVADEGMNKSVFAKFHQVFSGHFHTQSEMDNIKYIGSPFEMTWNDFNDKRGFHIFDTETGELEFIEYEESMFFKVIYHNKDDKEWIPYKPISVRDKFIKIIINEKDSYYDLDVWLKEIESYVPQELKIIDSTLFVGQLDETEMDIETLETKSNIDVINKHIEMIENRTEDEKAKIKNKLRQLYTEALYN